MSALQKLIPITMLNDILIIIGAMQKNLPSSHTLELSQKSCPQIFKLASRKHKLLVQVDFTPVKAISELKGEKFLTQFSILPTFNRDKKFYSQAFYNPFQGLQVDRNLQVKHQQRVKEISTQIPQNSILMPKPRRKDYCWVCQYSFDDYLQHIQSQAHSICVKASKFNDDILGLTEKYEKIPYKQKKITKKNILSTRNKKKLKKSII